MKNLTTFILALIAFVQSTFGQNEFSIRNIYPVDAGHSYINFVATYMGYAKVRGDFSEFKGIVYYDPNKPEKTSVSFELNVGSLDSNLEWRDRDLKSPNWFDAEAYPKITFSSSSCNLKNGNLVVTGEITIKKTSKTIELMLNPVIGPMHDSRGDDQIIFSGSYEISRKEFEIQGERWSRVREGITSVADEVTVEFSVLGKRINERNYNNFMSNLKSPQGQLYEAYKNGGIESMESVFQELKSKEDINSKPLNMVVQMLLRTNEFDNARKVAELNQKFFPDDHFVLENLAEVEAYAGNIDSAINYYSKALELDPTNIYTKHILGLMKKN